MDKHPSSYFAFTLIEVLVVMSIISISTALTLVSFSGYRTERHLERASREVASALREAQSYALSGRSVAGESNCWIGLNIPALGASYAIINNSLSGGTCSVNSTISGYTLRNGVLFTAITVGGTGYTSSTAAFTLPRGEMLYYNGAGMVTLSSVFRISLAKDGDTRYICVYPTGRVFENGTNGTCP